MVGGGAACDAALPERGPAARQGAWRAKRARRPRRWGERALCCAAVWISAGGPRRPRPVGDGDEPFPPRRGGWRVCAGTPDLGRMAIMGDAPAPPPADLPSLFSAAGSSAVVVVFRPDCWWRLGAWCGGLGWPSPARGRRWAKIAGCCCRRWSLAFRASSRFCARARSGGGAGTGYTAGGGLRITCRDHRLRRPCGGSRRRRLVIF